MKEELQKMFEVDEIQAQVGKMRGFTDENKAFQREVDIRNIARENGIDNNKPGSPERTPLHTIKQKRDDSFIGSHSHGKVTFGRARPENSLP
jgi:hypothetical protein